ncbi:PREDICTED: CCR4-NOT transcription complex subunit 1-like, partial [Wasmannia auropunctata]
EAPLTAFTPNSAVAVATAQQVAAYATVAVSNDEVGAMLEKLAAEVEVLMNAIASAVPPAQHTLLHSLLESIILTRRSRDANAAMTLLKKAVEGLLDGPIINSGVIDSDNLIQRYRELHLRILKTLQDPRAYGMQWTNKHVTRCLI